jgi:hypothetical protein
VAFTTCLLKLIQAEEIGALEIGILHGLGSD